MPVRNIRKSRDQHLIVTFPCLFKIYIGKRLIKTPNIQYHALYSSSQSRETMPLKLARETIKYRIHVNTLQTYTLCCNIFAFLILRMVGEVGRGYWQGGRWGRGGLWEGGRVRVFHAFRPNCLAGLKLNSLNSGSLLTSLKNAI